MSEELTQILLDAQSTDQEKRNQGMERIKSAKDNNLPVFLVLLAEELKSEEKPNESRQLAGIILKNTFVSKDEQKKIELANVWCNFKEDVRTEIKQILVMTLGSPNRIARHTSAQVIGAIGSIEYLKDLWPALFSDLIGYMNEETQKGSENIQEGVLTCIGYIAEELAEIEELPNVNEILEAISDGMTSENSNDELKLSATTALYNSLEFFESAFGKPQIRDHLMKAMINAAKNQNQKVSQKGLECLVKIAYVDYNSLENFIEDIYEITMKAMTCDNDLLALQSVEFWNTVCEEEEEINELILEEEQDNRVGKKYIQAVSENLVPNLCQLLTFQDEFEDSGWGVAQAATVSLSLISNLIENQITDLTIQFISDNIVHTEWNHKEAGIICLSSILEGTDTDQLQKVIDDALPLLLDYLEDDHEKVRNSSAYAIGRIFEYHFEAVAINTEVLENSIGALLNSLLDVPHVASNAAWALNNLAEANDYTNEETSPLSSFFMPIVEKLSVATLREDGEKSNLRFQAYEAISTTFLKSAQDTLDDMLLAVSPLLERLEATFSMELLSSNDEILQSQIQGSLCGVLQFMSVRLDKQIEEYAERLINCFLQVFKNPEAVVHEEAMMAIDSLINALGTGFLKYLEVVHPYFIGGINSYKQERLCSLTTNAVGDLFKTIEREIPQKCHSEYVDVFLEAISSEELENEVKPDMILVFGDIALSICGEFEPYLERVTETLEHASSVEYTEEDNDQINYIQNLQRSVLETYSGIIQGLKDDQKEELFLNYCQSIIEFLVRIHDTEEDFIDDKMLKAAAGLIGDILSILGNQVKEAFQIQPIQELVNACANSEKKSVAEVGKWALSRLL
ncbi:importin subunit beta-1 [Anaeramoeba flamelloides]|uniref:Importin subunit beta-1 n=1 Tax=Anaeramoeba flamelloides TaxID=1746091 RepID=A0AAV7Z7D7_9EUKA|nr:importin subunit beta-1 [Anaeramoeba flamelloides]KAJ6233382.1 importin subunit beta-1 [Anaeramoeba flamelloides]